MSGHSKWATTKRQKAVVDAKRGNLFTKLSNLISIAARKGADPVTNFNLRLAVEKARGANMPKDNIERAIKRGSGAEGKAIEELIYEGVGPVQSQFIVKCLTDSRNRAAANIRHLFTKHGGSLGSVAWNFEQKAVLMITNDNLKNTSLDDLELELIDLGCDDFIKEDEGLTILAQPNALQKIKQFLEQKNILTESADIEMVAKEKIHLTSSDDQQKIEKFIEALESDDDVSEFFHNVA